MKKILGLDLGSASIGWALISENENNESGNYKILGIGSRIIPYEGTEGKDFEKGTGESRNAIRTRSRSMRRGYDRYQLRRKYLVDILIKHGMMPDDTLVKLSKIMLWELRSKAVVSQVSLKEFGRILLWLNQKRGYKSSRSDANLDKKDTEYLIKMKSRSEMVKESGLTVGQYFYQKIASDQFFRIKDNVFPRESYIEEFDKICLKQKHYYPEVLNDELISKIRNEIIYFQRPLKSQKGLVSVCEFEGFITKGKDGKEYFVGPKVAPKSSPLFQVAKIWENINNIKISSIEGNPVVLTIEQKQSVFQHLDNNEKLSPTDLYRILKLQKDRFHLNKQLEKGLQGNLTKHQIRRCFDGDSQYEPLMQLNLDIIENEKETYLYSKKTGEVLSAKSLRFVSPTVEKSPLYRLWHTIYSISDVDECIIALQKNFNICEDVAKKLAQIDFSKSGYGNKSVKVFRNILPYLMEGDLYSEAMCYAGYDHSNSLTSDENLKRKLLDHLKLLPKNSLRQPIVEKILNQMVNLVNSVIDKYGKPDEIRIELARELKQSKEERNDTDKFMNERQKENEIIAKKLEEEYGLRSTRTNIIKWRLYEEIDKQDKKLNAMCIYCGQPISLTEALTGREVDVEHIIPKSKLFDDSQSNKTLAHRFCNKDKNDLTAYDFMKGKSEQAFNEYLTRVNMLYNSKVIGKAKRDKLLMSENKIPNDFIDRQLRESQYIATKAREILQTVCYNVWTTTGTVTQELRHLWGWDDITMRLQMPKYKALNMTEFVEWETENGNSHHQKEIIRSWTKRDDQRHHAVDALAIACTKQGYIQRFNTLNSSKTRDELYKAVKERSVTFNEKRSLLEKYIISEQPISVREVENAVSNVLVSYKSGKKVAVWGKRKIGKKGRKRVVQSNVLVPRGPLSEDSVYGKIRLSNHKPVKFLFENPDLIANPKIKLLVEDRLFKFGNDPKNAFLSLKKEPIFVDKNKTVELKFGSCYQEEYVIKYQVNPAFNKVDKVIDGAVKRILLARLEKFNDNPKLAFKDVQKGDVSVKWYEDEGLKSPILSVRCLTGLSSVVPVKTKINSQPSGFVKTGSNHHVAIYRNTDGILNEHVCTFWHAVERKKYGFPVIIKDPSSVWDKIQDQTNSALNESFLEKLPLPNLSLVLSMQQNEMFVLGLNIQEFALLAENKQYSTISENLYRVQTLSCMDYTFRHHLETQVTKDNNAQLCKRFIRVKSLRSLIELNPIKVKIDTLGNITQYSND